MVAGWMQLAAASVLFGAAYLADDVSLLAIVLMMVVVTAWAFVIERPWEVPDADRVAPIPSTFIMRERRRWGLSKVMALVALVALYLGIVIFGGGLTRSVLGGIAFADGLEELIRGRAVAKWEDEHDLELLRERREASRLDRRYYGRPRTSS